MDGRSEPWWFLSDWLVHLLKQLILVVLKSAIITSLPILVIPWLPGHQELFRINTFWWYAQGQLWWTHAQNGSKYVGALSNADCSKTHLFTVFNKVTTKDNLNDVGRSHISSPFFHYNDVIMGAIAFQITSLTIVYSIVYSDADQRRHRSSASLAFVGTGEFPAQMASSAENVSILWRHYVSQIHNNRRVIYGP